jgi:hypothetical protein
MLITRSMSKRWLRRARDGFHAFVALGHVACIRCDRSLDRIDS